MSLSLIKNYENYYKIIKIIIVKIKSFAAKNTLNKIDRCSENKIFKI